MSEIGRKRTVRLCPADQADQRLRRVAEQIAWFIMTLGYGCLGAAAIRTYGAGHFAENDPLR